jgi:hypothetical protein
LAISTNDVAVGGSIKASTMLAVINGVNAIALNGTIPTSSATGVTVSPGGSVVFSNAPAVTVVGAFNTSYDNYRIHWDIPTQTANADLQMRLTNTGSDDTSANYSYMRGYDRGSDSTHTTNMVTAASVWVLTAGAAATQLNRGYCDLWSPALAAYTSGLAQAVVRNPTPQMYTTSTNLFMNTTTAYDGFTLYPVSGTISGTLRVYGYNNLA